jgi:hypothetical protein
MPLGNCLKRRHRERLTKELHRATREILQGS